MAQTEIQIVEFSAEWASAFASLNYEWIEKYFSVEKHDREILDRPHEFVISLGGQIFMAVSNDSAVGTVAMIPARQGVIELTKMAVSPAFQGQGIGDRLMSRCIEFAIAKEFDLIFLESHSKLGPALSLYRKFGFIDVPSDPDSLYTRADIRMELALHNRSM